MDAIELLRVQMKATAEYLENTMKDVTPELAQQVPPGKAHTIGGYYAHYLIMTDMMVNAMLKEGSPLYAGEWAGKTGVSAPLPEFDADWAKNHATWARDSKFDLPAMHEYAKAVFASTDDYLATLTPADLDKEVNYWGGPNSLGWAISMFLIQHVASGVGEIAAIKGVLGEKGFWEG